MVIRMLKQTGTTFTFLRICKNVTMFACAFVHSFYNQHQCQIDQRKKKEKRKKEKGKYAGREVITVGGVKHLILPRLSNCPNCTVQ